MNIKTENHGTNVWEGRTWSAIDDDTYDGPGSPIGWGRTEAAAINDLVEQNTERLEDKVEEQRLEIHALRAELAGEASRTAQALKHWSMENRRCQGRMSDEGDQAIWQDIE